MTATTMKIRQGDQYPINITIYDEDGSIITNDPALISNVAVYLNGRGKRYDGGQGQLQYDTVEQCWSYPLSQSETYALKPGKYEMLVRVQFIEDTIISDTTIPIEVIQSTTKEVLP